MKELVMLLSICSVQAHEFIVKMPARKQNESRVTIRENIVRFAGELLDCSSDCICKQVNKLSVEHDVSIVKQVISIIADMQKKLLAITRALLEHDKQWVKASHNELCKMADLLDELITALQREHELEWWKNVVPRLEKVCPKKR